MENFLSGVAALWFSFVAWLPNLISALLALLVGWIISYLIQSGVVGLLRGISFNARVERSSGDGFLHRLTNNPTRSIGNFVYYVAMTITVLVAVSYLKIPVINDFITRIYNYIPNIIGSIFILAVALAISASISALMNRWMGETITGKVIATAIPTIILSVAGFAILEQLRVAPVIISTTYIAIIGSLALASAIAFGLGGREVAGRILEQAYRKSSLNIGQAKRDLAEGAQSVRSDAAMVHAHERPKKRYDEQEQ